MRVQTRPLRRKGNTMIAPALFAFVAAPVLLALWVAAWLVGDLFAGPLPATVRVRSRHDAERR